VVALHEARMKYFCQLLNKARWPYCGINGAGLLFSLRVTENEGNAQKIALAAQKDLRTLSEGLKLQFPIFVMLSDIDKWSGAASFLARFPEEKRKNRLGRGFPLAPDVTMEKYPALVERDVEWVFDHLLPYWSFRFLRLETPNIESAEEAVQSNAEVFHFLAQSQQRAPTVARMVAKALEPDEDNLPLLGGCYVVAQSAGQPWFTQDLFAKLEGAQDYVSWTQAAFDEDDDYKAWTWYGYGFLILVWLLLAGLAYYWYTQRPSS
jgi:type VI protein secretion system component VasK